MPMVQTPNDDTDDGATMNGGREPDGRGGTGFDFA